MPDAYARCASCGSINRLPDGRPDGLRCGSCRKPLEIPSISTDAGQVNFSREAANWPGLALAFIWSPSCGYCRQMEPAITGLARQKAGFLKVVKVNTATEPQLAASLGIQGVPTVILYRAGQILGRVSGAMSSHDLENWIHYLSGA